MDMSSKVIPLHLHPLGFIESFVRFGASLKSLLDNTKINNNMIDSRDIKISYYQLNKLIKNGVRQCNLPGIGLLIGRDMDWSYHGTMGSVVYCSPSLKDASNAYFRFLSIAQPFHSARSHEKSFFVDPDGMIVDPILTFGPTAGDQTLIQFEVEFQLAITLRLCELCGNKSAAQSAVHVCLEYPEPKHSQLYRNLPCTTICFNCERSSVSAHLDFIAKPWREFRRAAFYRTIAQCEEELQNSNLDNSLSSKVRWLISTNYFHRRVSLEKISEDLHMTPRSLTRKLANENTSFRTLYHEVRMEITSQHLKNSKLSVDDIAGLMRFSSISSLRRAVKNWSGSTVSEFRTASTTDDLELYSTPSRNQAGRQLARL